ncbi:MAG: ATP-binding cassette domain-containing protein [Actinomycetota bacterium]|nr:MAG: ATP-binding cassette domain-containing protein [Actinomycetota bacterium]
MSTAAVLLQDAAVVRGGSTVWSQGSLEIPAGSLVAVVGPNGSGKTTLLQVLLGLLPLSSGRVEVLGHPPSSGNPRIGYVPQNYASAAGDCVRCRDLVALGVHGTRWGLGRLSDDQRQAVDSALHSVGAASYAHRRMSQLSGGQQQRVAIAAALVSSPDLLLLDEPLANLDVRNQREVVDLLGQIGRTRQVTVLVVAHDLGPLLGALTGVVYLLDGHPHYAGMDAVADGGLLDHLYGARPRIVRTAQGDLFLPTEQR